MNGKGSKWRRTDFKKFWERYDEVRWTKKVNPFRTPCEKCGKTFRLEDIQLHAVHGVVCDNCFDRFY